MLAEDHLCDMIRFLEEVRGILFFFFAFSDNMETFASVFQLHIYSVEIL